MEMPFADYERLQRDMPGILPAMTEEQWRESGPHHIGNPELSHIEATAPEGTQQYLFIIDTDSYAGNFEREMGAYLTGAASEYFPEKAEELAALAREEIGEEAADAFFEILDRHEGDGDIPSTYVATWETPGWLVSNGVEFREENRGPEGGFPAHMSVALIFAEEPTPEMLSLLEARARAFPGVHRRESYNHARITVTGTRFIRRTTEVTDVLLFETVV